jgi:hypothetical protein
MSDDHRVTAPVNPASDDAREDDDGTAAPPAVEPKVEKSVPVDRPSQRSKGGGESPSVRRVRARMTLRIPDDEVSRPTPVAMRAADPVEPAEPPVEIKGTRIISVGPPPMNDDDEPEEVTAPTPPVSTVPADCASKAPV